MEILDNDWPSSSVVKDGAVDQKKEKNQQESTHFAVDSTVSREGIVSKERDRERLENEKWLKTKTLKRPTTHCPHFSSFLNEIQNHLHVISFGTQAAF